ncbi:MAG TPA: hypothetical protein VMT98_01770 [Verrucomicrobiae bacterium]|jgi:hypothetical protein|nr:hypothetical protein [Verrucomicrobiae bacterium]
MRALIAIALVLALAGCADPSGKPAKKYLFDTERCSGAGPKDSQEYKDCETKLGQEDARRLYNLNNSGQSVPHYVPPPPNLP